MSISFSMAMSRIDKKRFPRRKSKRSLINTSSGLKPMKKRANVPILSSLILKVMISVT